MVTDNINHVLLVICRTKQSYVLFTSEKTKDAERLESPGDGSNLLLSGSSDSVESEKQDITDVEQLQTKKPDEVCRRKYNLLLCFGLLE